MAWHVEYAGGSSWCWGGGGAIFVEHRGSSKISYSVCISQYLPNIVYISRVSLKKISLSPGQSGGSVEYAQVVAAASARWRNLCRAPAGQEEGGREATKPLTFYSNSLKLVS